MTSGYVACSFDLLNVRDLEVIRLAHLQCDHLIVGVLTDRYIQSWHGRPPVVPLEERLELVRHVGGVDQASEHDGPQSAALPTDCVVFAVDDEEPGYEMNERPVVLRPAVQSKSWVLREAIRRVSAGVEGAR